MFMESLKNLLEMIDSLKAVYDRVFGSEVFRDVVWFSRMVLKTFVVFMVFGVLICGVCLFLWFRFFEKPCLAAVSEILFILPVVKEISVYTIFRMVTIIYSVFGVLCTLFFISVITEIVRYRKSIRLTQLERHIAALRSDTESGFSLAVTLMNKMPNPVTLLDKESRILLFNNKLEETIRESGDFPGKLEGESILRVIPNLQAEARSFTEFISDRSSDGTIRYDSFMMGNCLYNLKIRKIRIETASGSMNYLYLVYFFSEKRSLPDFRI